MVRWNENTGARCKGRACIAEMHPNNQIQKTGAKVTFLSQLALPASDLERWAANDLSRSRT